MKNSSLNYSQARRSGLSAKSRIKARSGGRVARRSYNLKKSQATASRSLSRLRQGSFLALSFTTVLVLISESWSADEKGIHEEPLAVATGTLENLSSAVQSFLPRILVVVGVLLMGWLLSSFLAYLGRRFLNPSLRKSIVLTVTRLAIFFLTFTVALTVLAGDFRAVLGSLGLLGLALSWALQGPIESFAGWVLNAFQGFYRVGDRIEVGAAFGDVYRIDVLTTTLWELGGPGKSVSGTQPTGALITFPNSEALRSNIVNYSRDFPYMWDEIVIVISESSDLRYTLDVIREVAARELGDEMSNSAQEYRDLLQKNGLNYEVQEEPQVYLTPGNGFVNFTIRYLVPLSGRRAWSSRLFERVSVELAKDSHGKRIHSGYPRNEIILQNLGAEL